MRDAPPLHPKVTGDPVGTGAKMLDMTPIIHQRSVGEARVALDLRYGQTRLALFLQSGSGKAFLLRVASDLPEVVFLNTSGGLTGGDSLTNAIDVGAGCRVLATTQTAGRAYRSDAGMARVDIAMTTGAGD